MSDESDDPDADDRDAGSAGSAEGPSDAPEEGSSPEADGADDTAEDVGIGGEKDPEDGGLQKLEGGSAEPPDDVDDRDRRRTPDRSEERSEVRFSDDDDPPPGHGVEATAPGEFVSGDGEEDAPVTAAADGATAAGTSTGTGFPPEGGPGDPLIDDDEPAQPPDDEEMPLADHIEEMVKRLAVVFIAVAIATGLAFPFAEGVINAMWYGLLPPDTPAPHVYGPLEKILAEVKVASLAGILVALPVLVYESYLFMRPGLYPRERRYFLSSVPTSLVLGAIGMAFAYFLVLPVLFDYFIFYSKSGVDKLAFGLRVTFDLIVALLGAFALVFQIPLLIMLAIMMGVTSRQWLESRRLYFWGGFLGLGFLMGGADLTGMAPIIIAATMIGLFEGTLALLRWTRSG